MKEYEQQIERLRKLIADATAQLAQLESEQQAYLDQQEKRQAYLSSREILDLLEARQGRTGSMASIKRWADHGYLGTVIDERETFPLLANKQGNRRFLYPRESVLRFLYEKGFLSPRCEVLDRVQVKTAAGTEWALVTSVERQGLQFRYQLQLESTGVLLTSVAEEDLLLP